MDGSPEIADRIAIVPPPQWHDRPTILWGD